MIRKKILCMIMAIMMFISVLPLHAMALEQQGANPFVLNPDKEIDNLESLTAASAERPDAITIFNAGVPKYFWINNFGGRTTDYLEWTVQSDLAATTDYYAWLHIGANAGTEFKITVTQGDTTTETSYTKASGGWEVAEFGILKIPAGVSKIRLTKVTAANQNCLIKGLDMIRESDRADYLNRVQDYRTSGQATREKFGSSDYGLFFQYGVWGYPQTGPRKNMEDATNDFDVEDFINLLKITDAKFIIWSLTWYEYKMQMPVQAVDDIMGHSNLTTERNLVLEIAERCKEEGIDFYMYYHQGIQQEPTWKAKQNWPDSSFTNYGVGDRSTFFENWLNVITEIGETLGTKLDGWFFDDGCVYYPAPFEAMAEATKAGNSKRIVSYNAWTGTKVTEFQDMIFGEGGWGGASDTTDGVYNSGREAGLQQVGMPRLGNDWGIHNQNQAINLTTSASTIINNVKSASSRNVPVAMAVEMWEEGVIGEATFEALIALKKAMQGEEQLSESWVNDNDPDIEYSEDTGWKYGGTVYSGYYQNDAHITKSLSPAPSVEYAFTGTGISVISKKASWAANAKVYIDGDEAGEALFNGTPESNQFAGFVTRDLEYGEHTIRLEYSAEKGSEAQLDAFIVYDDREVEKDYYPVTKLDLSASSTTMGHRDEMQMQAIIKPQYATDKTISWSVANSDGTATKLAVIDDNGLLEGTGKGYGTVVVTATSLDNPEISGSFAVSLINTPKRTTVYGNDDSIVRIGSWTVRAASKSSDSQTAGNTAEFEFEGTAIEWYGVTASDHGIAKIYIDGEEVTVVDCYSSSRRTDILLYRSDELEDGTHTIKLEVDSLRNDNATNRYIEIYRFIVEQKQDPILEEPEITVDENIENGYIVYNPKNPEVGDTVTVTVTPFSGYVLKAGSLKYNNTSVTADESGDYTFTMPAEDVVLTAKFIADMTRLQNLMDTCEELDKDLYTADSWTNLETAMIAAEAVLADEDSTVSEVRAAYSALMKAHLELVNAEEISKVYLDELIRQAKLIDTTGLRPGLVTIFENALKKAEEVSEDSTATQKEVNETATELLVAIINLKEIIDREDVEDLIDILNNLDEDNYTEESWKALEKAIEDAQKLTDDSSQADVDAAYDELCDAYEKLEKIDRDVNKEALENALEDGKLILTNIDDFIPSTVKGLKEIYDRAKAIYDDPGVSQADVDKVTQELAEANTKARVKEDKSALEATAKEAAALDARNYTAASYAVLSDALEEAQKVLENDEATAEEIAAAIELIEKARLQLKELDDNSESDETEDTVEDTTEDSSTDSTRGDRNKDNEPKKKTNGNNSGKGGAKTGDGSHIIIWLLSMMSGIGISVVLIRKRRIYK